jgi:prolyl oligopeptidase
VRPPETRRDNFREVLHGVEILDPYRWLEDQDSPETRRWIEAQNGYAKSLLALLAIRKPIGLRLAELMNAVRVGPPLIRNGYYYFAKREGDAELWSTWRRKGPDEPDELLLDPNQWSEDKRTSGGMVAVSRNGRVLAYDVRRGGEDETEIRFLDLESRKDLATRLPRHLNRGFALRSDGSGCYYTVQNRETGPRIRYRDLATGRDVEIFGQGYGPERFVAPALTDDDRYLIIYAAHGWARNDLLLKDLAADGPVIPIVRDVPASFRAQPAGNRLVIQTDWKAPKRRLLVADLKSPQPEHWKEIVPESDDPIESFTLAGGKIYVRYLRNVASAIRTFSIEGKPLGEVSLPGLGSASLQGDWEESEAVLSFRSFNHPPATFRLDTKTGRLEVFYRPEVPIRPEDFEVRQVWYRSKDGTRVPMFLVHRKGLKPDGNLPALLHGYGGFNVSLTPFFSPQAALWIEQGGVFAVANLRGGGEFGEAWHRAGMLDEKQNVFDDFIAAAEWLIANRYTNPRRLAIQGGSNGGLLVGAALTQRPDLFRAVLCHYPDLDMVGYHRFKNNNKPALAEYGDASKPEHFKFLYAYSPYQRVKEGVKYPAVLLTTGDADTRVPPLQARKMAARLQASTASGLPVLLLYDTQAGHAGGRPRSKMVEDATLEMAFLFQQLGMEWR